MSAGIGYSARQRTGPQMTAAAPDASVWVSANAGTGKTGVLVDRISRLLLDGVNPEQILCLTFTKAAAAEMANRLSALLSRWSAMPEQNLRSELSSLGEVPVDAERIATARRLFAQTLEAPEGLRIRTIHSFCESLLGRFPLEAEITPDFRVMDERDQRELRAEARDRVLTDGLAKGTALSDALYDLAGLVDETQFADLVREIDSNRGKFVQAVNRCGGVEALVNAIADVLGISPSRTVEDVILEASDLDVSDLEAAERLCAAWANGAATNKAAAAAVEAWLALPPEQRVDTWRTCFAAAFLTTKGELRSEKTLLSKDAKAHDPAAFDIAVEFGEQCLATVETLKAVNTFSATRALIRVGASLIDAYDDVKYKRGRLDYDDLIERAASLLRSPGGVSWVHFKLDGGISHVLVDEAQDTSPAQWDVIDQVSSDFFSGESRHQESTDSARTIFAVGDEKQSIYSFQGAAPAMFGAMRERFARNVTAVGQAWKPVEMAESFRSAPAILTAVDRIFGDQETAKGLSFDGSPVRHISARVGQAGVVELWPKEEPHEDDGAGDPWDAPIDHVPTDSPEQRVAARIADTIDNWLRSAETLPAQGRAIRPGDILILVQKRRRFAELMVGMLKDRGIPVSGRDRMILPEQLAIRDLIALGRLTLLPEDDLNTATVLKGPLLGLSEDALFEVAHGRKGTVLSALHALAESDPVASAAYNRISAWRARADYVPPFEFYSDILNAEGGRRALMADLGPDASEPIDDFLSAALDYERNHVPSMEGFLHWVESGAAEVKRDLEQGRDEVRVMTVHGAKGLQSEIVFIADACSVPATQTDSKVRWTEETSLPLWPAFSENETETTRSLKEVRRAETEEEYRRLLYVALTRAKDRLYVCGYAGKRIPSVSSWYEMVDAGLRELAGETTEPDGRVRLSYEEQQSEPPDGAVPESDFPRENKALPAWAESEPADEPLPPKPLSPSRPDGDEPPVHAPLDYDRGARFKRGRVIHALLQTLPDLPIEKRRNAARGYLSGSAHGFDESTRSALLDEVMSILEDPILTDAFGPGSKAEVPVVGTVNTTDGPRTVSGQIDRLVHTGDEILIIDFKTNRPPPSAPAEVADIYVRQMAIYRAALKAMYPEARIRAVLLWTDGPRWMELPDNQLDAHTP